MRDKLTDKEIITRIEAAFAPHRTVAEFWDYGYRIRFQVRTTDSNAVIYTQPEVLSHLCRSETDLTAVIETARAAIAAPVSAAKMGDAEATE